MKLVSSGKSIMCEGTTAEILGTFTSVLKRLYREKAIDEDDIAMVVKLVKATDEEVDEIFKKELAERKEDLKKKFKSALGKRDVEDLVDEFIDDFFEKEN